MRARWPKGFLATGVMLSSGVSTEDRATTFPMVGLIG